MKHVFFETSVESQWGGFVLRPGVNLLQDDRAERALKNGVVREASEDEVKAFQERERRRADDELRLNAEIRGAHL